MESLGSSFIGEIVYNGGKALSTRTFFSRKKCFVNRVQWILINQTWFTLSTNKDLSTPIDFKGHGSKDKVTFVLTSVHKKRYGQTLAVIISPATLLAR
jgi:hypothetical protein